MNEPEQRQAPVLSVIDYGVNNVGSVTNMLRHIGVSTRVVANADELADTQGIVLPGIGAFDTGITNLRDRGLYDALVHEVTVRRTAILGICLGMQLLSRRSEEGSLEGLGLIDAETLRIPADAARTRKIPHMGWNDTECFDPDLFDGLQTDARFYYVHSYHVACRTPGDVAARFAYGEYFTAAVRSGHVAGTQFHPEKSHRFGMRLLANFARMVSNHRRRAEPS